MADFLSTPRYDFLRRMRFLLWQHSIAQKQVTRYRWYRLWEFGNARVNRHCFSASPSTKAPRTLATFFFKFTGLWPFSLPLPLPPSSSSSPSLPLSLTPSPSPYPRPTWSPYLGSYLFSATCISELMGIPLQTSDHKEGKQAENKRFPFP